MRKIALVLAIAMFLAAPSNTDAAQGCQKCGQGFNAGTFSVECVSPSNNDWGYEFCEVHRLPKPGYFLYCVQSGSMCLYTEVR